MPGPGCCGNFGPINKSSPQFWHVSRADFASWTGRVRAMSERELFEAALEHAPAERARFLDEACAGDPELRGQVEALLARHTEAESFLERPAVWAGFTAPFPPVAEAPGAVIGSYKLLQQIGEGGFGVVYMAEQERPV